MWVGLVWECWVGGWAYLDGRGLVVEDQGGKVGHGAEGHGDGRELGGEEQLQWTKASGNKMRRAYGKGE
jgi:hypothetical protein